MYVCVCVGGGGGGGGGVYHGHAPTLFSGPHRRAAGFFPRYFFLPTCFPTCFKFFSPLLSNGDVCERTPPSKK